MESRNLRSCLSSVPENLSLNLQVWKYILTTESSFYVCGRAIFVSIRVLFGYTDILLELCAYSITAVRVENILLCSIVIN